MNQMILKTIHSLFFYILLVLSYVIGTSITLLFVPFFKNKTRPFQIAARLWARFLIFCSGIKVKVSGIENIEKDKSYIIAANHQGAADILLALAYLPVYFRFAIKKELFKVPIFGWYLRKAGYFPVDRKLILSAYKIIETMNEITKSGDSVLIFPEGTRSRTGELGPFKRGSLLTALKSQTPVVPVAISGSFDLMPAGTFIIHPHPVKLSAAKPVYIKSQEEYEAKVAEIREAIAGML